VAGVCLLPLCVYTPVPVLFMGGQTYVPTYRAGLLTCGSLSSWLPSQDGAQFIKASLPAIITYRNSEYRLSGFCAKVASHIQWPDRPGLAPGSLFSCSFSRSPTWI